MTDEERKEYFHMLSKSIHVKEVTVSRNFKTEDEDFGVELSAEVDGDVHDAIVCTHILSLRSDLLLTDQAFAAGVISEDFHKDRTISLKNAYGGLISAEMARLAHHKSGGSDAPPND